MSTKAAFLRENITIDQVSMQWTCNQCFKDRLGTPGLEKKPLKAYAYTGTSNVSRHFDELHKEQLAEAMVRIGQSKLERRKGMGKREYLKRPRPVKRQKLEDGVVKQDPTVDELLGQHHHPDQEDNGTCQEQHPWVEEDEEGEGEEEESSQASLVNETLLPSTGPSAALDEPLKIFFDAMYASVRKMARPDIFHIRRKLFEMVTEVEEMQEYQQVEVGQEEIIYQEH